MHQHIGVIGYGEVGKIFAGGLKLKSDVETVSAWDLKFLEEIGGNVHVEHAQSASIFVAK